MKLLVLSNDEYFFYQLIFGNIDLSFLPENIEPFKLYNYKEYEIYHINENQSQIEEYLDDIKEFQPDICFINGLSGASNQQCVDLLINNLECKKIIFDICSENFFETLEQAPNTATGVNSEYLYKKLDWCKERNTFIVSSLPFLNHSNYLFSITALLYSFAFIRKLCFAFLYADQFDLTKLTDKRFGCHMGRVNSKYKGLLFKSINAYKEIHLSSYAFKIDEVWDVSKRKQGYIRYNSDINKMPFLTHTESLFLNHLDTKVQLLFESYGYKEVLEEYTPTEKTAKLILMAKPYIPLDNNSYQLFKLLFNNCPFSYWGIEFTKDWKIENILPVVNELIKLDEKTFNDGYFKMKSDILNIKEQTIKNNKGFINHF